MEVERRQSSRNAMKDLNQGATTSQAASGLGDHQQMETWLKSAALPRSVNQCRAIERVPPHLVTTVLQRLSKIFLWPFLFTESNRSAVFYACTTSTASGASRRVTSPHVIMIARLLRLKLHALDGFT